MNLQNIRPDEDYAYVEYRRKGVFPRSAHRVTVVEVSKRKLFGNKNATGRVRIRYTLSSGRVVEEVVEARNIVDFWDDYEIERTSMLAREEKVKEEAKFRREQRTQEADALKRYLHLKLGIPPHAVITVTETTVNLNRAVIEALVDVKYDPIGQMEDTRDAGR